MRGELLLALDLGTTRVRALVLDGSGAVRGRAALPLATRFPAPGHVEQDPDEMWSASVEVLRRALGLARAGARDVAGLGIVTQRSTALAWDAATGRPLAPAISWQDVRTRDRVGALRARGIPATTLASAVKFEWWLHGDPAVKQAARRGHLRLGTPDAWLGFRASGGALHVTDPGHACCTGLASADGSAWSSAAASLFGVDPEWLPRLAPTAAILGESEAALCGVPIPLAARAGDQQAASFAQGVHGPGEAKLTLGTSAMLDVHCGARPARPPRGSYALALWRLERGEPAFAHEATVITAGAALDWLVDLGLLRSPAEADPLARSVPDAAGVACVPALQGLGSPWLEDGARGLLVGLTRGTQPAHLVRALLEGIAQRCADCVESLAPGEGALRVDGGLAACDFLVERIADLTGRTVLRAAETETTALGAAQLAGLAAGVFADPAACRATLAPAARFEPRAGPGERAAARALHARAVERTRP
jgi:glycerol kinase